MTLQPRDWCTPPKNFGRLGVKERVWLPPDPNGAPLAVAKFRAAVMQNAIVLAVRGFKNLKGVPQEELARLDLRSDSMNMWNARLCGRANLSSQDIATLTVILPGALPSEEAVRIMIEVAEGRVPRPKFWDFPDSSKARPVT